MSKHQPFDHVPLEQRLKLDIRAVAHLIELKLGDLLQPAPAGVYVVGQLEPVIVEGTPTYTRNGKTATLITDLNQVKTAVHSEDGKQLIPTIYMQRKEKFVSNVPFLPYHGTKIVELLITEQIAQYSRWQRNAQGVWGKILDRHLLKYLDGFNNLPDYLDDDAYYEHLRNTLDACYDPLRVEVAMFIDKHEWKMFDVKPYGEWVQVDRLGDWRAYQWELEYGAGHRGIVEESEET